MKNSTVTADCSTNGQSPARYDYVLSYWIEFYITYFPIAETIRIPEDNLRGMVEISFPAVFAP